MNNWLPYKAVISMGVVGYPGPRGWTVDLPSNANCVLITAATKLTTTSKFLKVM